MIVKPPIYVCKFYISPKDRDSVAIYLKKWPSLRWRFFVWLFSGIKVEAIK